MWHGGVVGSIASSLLQCPWFDPKLGLLFEFHMLSKKLKPVEAVLQGKSVRMYYACFMFLTFKHVIHAEAEVSNGKCNGKE